MPRRVWRPITRLGSKLRTCGLVALIGCAAIASREAEALPKAPRCDGYFVTSQQGYKKAPNGMGLVPSGPMVPQGTTMAFSAVGKMGGRSVLYQAGSSLIFDGENISLPTGCQIPTR